MEVEVKVVAMVIQVIRVMGMGPGGGTEGTACLR